MLGNLDQYTKFQTAEAIRDAAKNPGGIAGVGAGIGAGMAIGQQMGGGDRGGRGPRPSPSGLLGRRRPAAAADSRRLFHAAIDGAADRAVRHGRRSANKVRDG